MASGLVADMLAIISYYLVPDMLLSTISSTSCTPAAQRRLLAAYSYYYYSARQQRSADYDKRMLQVRRRALVA